MHEERDEDAKLLTGARVVSAEGILDRGWVRIDGERITGLGSGEPPDRPSPARTHDLSGRILVPGFVDMHVHGGGGASYTSGDPADARRAMEAHRRHGTTTTMASLVSASPDDLHRSVTVLADLFSEGAIAGIHLEGPWIAHARRGAHDPSTIRAPTAEEIDGLLTSGRGAVRMVTIAPELDGAVDAIRHLVAAGVVVAVGHTEADFRCTLAAVEAGATVGTHLFNAMRPIHQHEPGPVLALLADDRVTLELIADGVHVHEALLRHVLDAAGTARVALVTDAMAAAALGDGRYRLGSLDVTVSAGVATLEGTDVIAGSTATMDAMFRHAVQACGLSLRDAAQVTSTTPANALGLTDVGQLAVGHRADAVVLDDDLHVLKVLHEGRWLPT